MQLRERSDTFFRGFLVLFVAGVIAGAFGATETLAAQLMPPPPKEVVVNALEMSLGSTGLIPPALAPVIEGYATNAVSLVYELEQLPPQAGAWAIPLANALDWVGTTTSTPYNLGYIGWTLLAGLIFGGVASWLGGRNDLNKMLGLTALAAAPQVFLAIPALLAALATLTGITALTGLNGLFGLVISLWSAVIYVKATAVAQQFSLGRAIASIALGLVLLAGLVLVMTLLIAFAFAQFV
ncbi:MAG: YIP1 family protein [Anaerolineales bacterium]|nr:YIP1 family protein [Anaerolineales bacterium]